MLSIALALIVSQNPWQWANDPTYYSGPVIDYCRNGGDCRVRKLTIATQESGAFSAPLNITTNISNKSLACFQNTTNALSLSRNSQYFDFGVSTSCGAGFTAYPLQIDTTALRVITGSATSLLMDGHSNETSFPAPSTGKGFVTSLATGQMYVVDGTRVRRLIGTDEPVIDGMTYCYGWNDATPGYQIGGSPGADSTFTAISPVESCAAGTIANAMAAQTLPTKTMRVRTYTTQAAINAQCNRVFSHWTAWSDSLPIVQFAAGINATTAVRARIGWAKNTVFTTSTDAPADHGAWIRFSSVAGDTNYMACTGDGTTTSCTSTGVAIDTAVHTFEIDMSESTSVITFWVDKQARVRKTTNLPGTASTLSWGHDVTATTAVARVMSVGLQCVRR